MIASGSSLRGLSDVTTTKSASRAATAPISGRFARSRSPPHPNAQITRLVAGQRARSTQRVVQRVGRVRVIDHDGKRLAHVDRLEASGHGAQLLDACLDCLQWMAGLPGSRRCGQAVEHVEVADEGRCDLDLVASALWIEPTTNSLPHGPDVMPSTLTVAPRIVPEADHRDRTVVKQSDAVEVLEVRYSPVGAWSRREQHPLGGEVFLHVRCGSRDDPARGS